MKKIINILTLIFFVGSFASLTGQTYVKTSENISDYTADATTNHIFTMVKTGGNYDPIIVNVSLNKAEFTNTGDNSKVGWGTGNNIPASWDFEITNVNSGATIEAGNKSFKFSNDPIVDVTVNVRVFDSNGTITGLSSVPLTYRLEGIFTQSESTFVACSGKLKIVVNEVSIGTQRPCAGTDGDPKYNIKVYNAGTTTLVTEVSQTSNEFLIPLEIGDYDYVITDGCGRTFSSGYDITDAPEIGATVIFAGKECSTDSDTKIVLKIQGTKRPLSWVLEKKNGDNWEAVYTNLNVGGNASSTSDITASGTGSFTLSVSGLTGDGVYKYTFTDANSCVKSTEFNVATPSPLSHLLVASDVATKLDLNCSGDADGKLTFTGSGGWTQPFNGNTINPINWGPGYTFTLINSDTGAEVGVVNSNSWFNFAKNGANEQIGWEATFDNLPPGNYKLKLKESVATNTDADPDVIFGCEVLFPDIYTIAAPSALSVTGTKTDISCFGDDDGVIDLTISGGTPIYTIAWTKTGDGSFNASSEDLTGLAPGEYNVTVTDSKNCSQSTSFTIVEPAQLSAELDTTVATAIDCYDNNGVIKADITVSSTAPFTYVINGTDYNNNNVSVSSGETTNTSHNFSVKAGVYTVTVTDSRGCAVTTGQRTLTQPASGMTVTGTVSADFNGFENGDGLHMSCNGGTNGEIDLTVSGGTAGYTYAWTAVSGSGLDSTSQDQTGLTAGVYEVVVTDNTGCTISRRYVVSDPAPLTIPINDMAPGDKGNYTYLGELGTSKYYLSDATLTYMEARDIAANLGGYLVSIKTQAENQWLIDNSSDQNFWLGLDDIREESKVLGVVDKTKYRWNDGTSLDWEGFPAGEPNDASKDTTINSPGEDYIEFSNGSWNDIFHHVKRKFVIEFNPTQIPDFNGSSISCFGGTNGSIDFVVTGGTTPYTYAWTTADGSGLDVTSKSQSGLGAGTYSVTVTDSTGCTKSIDYTITQPDELQMAFDDTVNSTINCFGDNGTLKVDISQESVAPYTYLLEGTELVSGNLVSQSLTDQTVLTQTYNTLKAGTYKVTITDANGCVKVTPEKSLTQPAAGLSISEVISVHNGFSITCNGASDGSIDLTVAGGAVNYTYAWTTTDGSGLDAAVADQTGLGPGTYKVEISDSNNCKIDKTYTISEPDALSLSQSSSDFNGFDASCSGGVDATIDLTITGGAPTYSYAWTTTDGSGLDATAEDQSGLSAGTYDVIVTDLNGCQISDSFLITEPPPIVLTSILSDFNGFNISCNGESDGSIDITVSGGTISGGDTDYTYEWTTLNGTGLDTSVPDQTGLSAGTYTVKITDSNNCSLTRSIDILQADPIDLTGVLSDYNGYNVSVKGLADGFINITPVGGSGGYIYEWSTADGSGLIDGEQDQTGLTIGTYTLKLTDSNGCSTSKSFTLIEPTELKIDLGTDPTNILCFGEKTGVLKAIITQESVPSYKYTLNGTDYQGNVILETVSSITLLNHTFLVKAGIYTITVEDLNGGKKTSAQRTFTQPAAPLAISETISDFNGFNISCTGASDAAIDLTVTGGTITGTLYNYSWSTFDGSGLQPNIEDQIGLGPGTYTVLVEDENGCTVTKTYIITEPELIDYKLDTKNDISCFGANDGSINITVTKGTGVYNYAWTTEDGAGLDPTAEDQSGLSAGKYKLILTDGCQTLQYIYEIEEPAVLAIGLDEKVDILCFGDSTGKILVTVSGGTSPYNYEWIDNFGYKYNRDIGNVFNTGNLSNIPVGIYDLTVTDKNGCIETLKVELKEPDELKIDFNKVDVSCFNGNDGSIDVNPTGGVAPYTYSWSDFGNGKLRTDLVSGKYTVTVTDSNNCEKSVEIELKSAPQFNITSDVSPITCFGANDGSIKLTIDGGKAPISLEWADDPQAGTTRSNLKSGVYSVLLKDSSGCEINEIYTITEPAKLQLSAIKSDALDCDDPNSGSIDLQVIGGNPPFTYVWSNGDTTEDLSDVSANNYSVIVTDSKGCTVEKTFSIVRPFELKIDLTSNLRVVCETRDVYLVNKVTIEGGVFPYTVKWSSGDVSGSNGEIMETNVEGSYSVEVTDNNGCTKTQIFDVVLPKLGYPEFDYTSFYWQTFGALTFNDPITFTNNSTESFLSVSWDFGDGNSSDQNDPVHSYEKKGSYDVTLYVTYFSGCIYEIKKTIYVGDSYEIEFPNAFTPNGDGLNDTFRPVYYGFKSVDLQVFDTWGTLIYTETAKGANIMNGWNGMLNGKPATNGNYIFQVSGEAFNGETVLKNGPFTLLR